MPKLTKEEEDRITTGLSRKYQQLMDRVLYDIRSQALMNNDAAQAFMAMLQPQIERWHQCKEEDAHAVGEEATKSLMAMEHLFMEIMLKEAVIPALGATLKKLQSGDRLANTQAEMNAAARQMVSLALGNDGEDHDGEEESEESSA
jgi:hypothetical protein